MSTQAEAIAAAGRALAAARAERDELAKSGGSSAVAWAARPQAAGGHDKAYLAILALHMRLEDQANGMPAA